MISCDIDGVRFNYRVASVFVEHGHILLYRIAGLDFWFLPGGRAEGRCGRTILSLPIMEEISTTIIPLHDRTSQAPPAVRRTR